MNSYQPLLEKYNRQANSYDRRWNIPWGRSTMEAAMQSVPWDELGLALDVGCGTGLLEQAVFSRLGPDQ